MFSGLIRAITRVVSPASSPAMSNVNNPSSAQLPTYVYKILETAKTNPQFMFPVPIPASHLFRLPPWDAKDGFVHLSTATQIPGTLNRFFGSHDEVVLLKMDYKRLSAFKNVKWEKSGSDEVFPHLYGYGIEGENVESFKEVTRLTEGEKSEGWAEPLEQLKREGWLVY